MNNALIIFFFSAIILQTLLPPPQATWVVLDDLPGTNAETVSSFYREIMTIMIYISFGMVVVHFSTNMLMLTAFPGGNDVLAELSFKVIK